VTTYLFGDRGSRQAVAIKWKEAEAEGVAIDQAIVRRAPHALETRVDAALRPGDTLVVQELGCLGENYQEIAAAAHALMRRRVVLRSMEDNLVFDGAAGSLTDQASRDALIAHVAAAAAARKAALRAAQTRRTAVHTPPEELWKGQAGRLQFGVVAGQLATLGAAVLLLSFILPASHRRDIPTATFEARQARLASLARLPSEGPAKQSEMDPANLRESTPAASDSGPPERPDLSGHAAAFGLTPEEQRRAYAAVAEWRSARVRDPAFKADVGAVVPRPARLAVFPRRLVAQLPKLRGYRFVVAEARVAVVDPATRQIVGLLN